MLEKVKEVFEKIKSYVLPAGIIAFLVAVFSGQLFNAIIIGAATYYYWKNEKNVQEFIGKV